MAYECQNFKDGQVLTAECLNKMEKGIEDACSGVKTVNGVAPDENGNVNVEGGSGESTELVSPNGRKWNLTITDEGVLIPVAVYEESIALEDGTLTIVELATEPTFVDGVLSIV